MTKTQQALYHATVLTFEELAFLTQTDETPFAPESCETIGVDFHGDYDGQLILKIQNTLVPVIASNILGEFDTPCEEMQKDALCEVANVICGNALPDIFGKKAIFHLTKPQPVTKVMPDEIFQSAQHSAEVLLSIEEGCVGVWLYFNKK